MGGEGNQFDCLGSRRRFLMVAVTAHGRKRRAPANGKSMLHATEMSMRNHNRARLVWRPRNTSVTVSRSLFTGVLYGTRHRDAARGEKIARNEDATEQRSIMK
jgi:hypothetical protein